MESVADTNSVDLKVTELLKEVQLDYSPAFTKAVDDAVSAIKGAIDKIPENLKVSFLSTLPPETEFLTSDWWPRNCSILSWIIWCLFFEFEKLSYWDAFFQELDFYSYSSNEFVFHHLHLTHWPSLV